MGTDGAGAELEVIEEGEKACRVAVGMRQHKWTVELARGNRFADVNIQAKNTEGEQPPHELLTTTPNSFFVLMHATPPCHSCCRSQLVQEGWICLGRLWGCT